MNSEFKMPPLPKEKPIVYGIYKYLKANNVGYAKRIKASALMKEFNITDNKEFRGYIQEIRESSTLQKIVCSEAGSKGGYWIAKNEEEVYKTLDHLYKRAMEMLKCYSVIKNKLELDNQFRIKMTKYEKDKIESILR